MAFLQFITIRKLKIMIGVIATLNIKEGTGTEFESVANELVKQVNANEDGVVYYDLYKKDDTTYIFLERYKNEEAKDVHGKTDYFRSIGAKIGAFLTGAPDIVVLESV